MPIIESDSLVLSFTSVETTISASLTPEVRKGGRSRVNTTIVSVVNGSAFISAESEVATTIVSFANGGLAGTPDLFGDSEVATTIAGSLAFHLRIGGYSRVETAIVATFTDQVSEPEIFEALITLDLLTPRPAGGRMYTERLYVDGLEVPVREWQAVVKKDGFVDINIELHDPEQRSLITRTSLIKFEMGWANQPFDEFIYKTIIEDGYFNESAYQERADDSDTFTFTGLSAIHKRLNRTPANGLIVFDPNLVDVDISDFRIIYDDFGRPFEPEILAIPKLTMEKLFLEIYVNRCGFDDVFSNLPARKWSLSRVDFPAGRPYLEAFNSRIGMYFPSYDEIDDNLWIRGTRIPYPAGSPTPETIVASETMDLQLATDHRRVDVIELIFNLFTYEYDYTSQRTANATLQTDNNGDQVTTTILKTIQEYYRESQPTLPIHEEDLYIHTTDIKGDGTIMEDSIERFYYKGTNRIARRKFTQVPVPGEIPPHTPSMNLAATEMENYYWKPHPFKPSQIYQARRNVTVYGLVSVDTENPRADGTPFRQALVDSHRFANFKEGQTIESGAIRSEDEIINPLTRDLVEIRKYERDHLANITNVSWTENRVGDIGKSALVNDQRSLYIFLEESSERTLDFKEEMNIGELNPIEGARLARQELNRRKFRPNTVTDEIDGLDPHLIPGSTRSVQKRDGTSIGVFEIGDVTYRGSEQGYYTRFEGIQSA